MKNINEIQSKQDENARLDELKRKSASAVAAKMAEMDAVDGNHVTRVTTNRDESVYVTPVTLACISCPISWSGE